MALTEKKHPAIKALDEFQQWLNNELYNFNLYHDKDHDQTLEWVLMHLKEYRDKFKT
jgi:hypothetical protein